MSTKDGKKYLHIDYISNIYLTHPYTPTFTSSLFLFVPMMGKIYILTFPIQPTELQFPFLFLLLYLFIYFIFLSSSPPLSCNQGLSCFNVVKLNCELFPARVSVNLLRKIGMNENQLLYCFEYKMFLLNDCSVSDYSKLWCWKSNFVNFINSCLWPL